MEVETEVVVPVVLPVKPDFNAERQLCKVRSWMKPRLEEALKMHGAPDRIRQTLLQKETQERHAGWLSERFIAKFIKHYNTRNDEITRANATLCQLDQRENPTLTQIELAGNCVRFFTLLYEVVELDSNDAIKSVAAMKKRILATVKKVKKLCCLGAVEVEVISIPLLEKLDQMRSGVKYPQLPDDTTESFEQDALVARHRAKSSRKMAVCKKLYTGFQSAEFSGEYSQLLVHFHGVLIAKSKTEFEKFHSKLKEIPEFTKAKYQIEIKKLTESSWGGKIKTPTENLHCIANYLTKGAASRTKNNEADYKFKVKFDHGELLTEDQSAALEFINQEVVNASNTTSTDYEYRLDLSKEEVFVLADTVNKLMNLNTKRTGYLVQVGAWPT